MTPEKVRDLPEVALVRGLREGDEAAFATLFDRHLDVVEARIRRLVPPPVRRKISVSDVVQETRITAYERCRSFEHRGDGALRAWLLAIAERKAKEALRRHAGTAKRAAGREVPRGGRPDTMDLPARGRSPSEAAMAAEAGERVRSALAALPPDYAEVIRLTRLDGLTLAEAAGRMGRSREAVKKLNGRALAALAKHLGTDEDSGG